MSYGHAGRLAALIEAVSTRPATWQGAGMEMTVRDPQPPPRCPDCGAAAVYVVRDHGDKYDAYLCPTLGCERVYVLVTDERGTDGAS